MAVLGILLLLPVLLVCAQSPTVPGCSPPNVTVVASEDIPPELPGTLQYSTSVVDSEYIVVFTSYYTTQARDGFITAALRPFQNWSILPRTNPSADYPSDFSLVRLGNALLSSPSLKALTHHPLVKTVMPQKKLTRTLAGRDGERGNFRRMNTVSN